MANSLRRPLALTQTMKNEYKNKRDDLGRVSELEVHGLVLRVPRLCNKAQLPIFKQTLHSRTQSFREKMREQLRPGKSTSWNARLLLTIMRQQESNRNESFKSKRTHQLWLGQNHFSPTIASKIIELRDKHNMKLHGSCKQNE